MIDTTFRMPVLQPAGTTIDASGQLEQASVGYGVRGDTCNWCGRTRPTSSTVRDSETGISLCTICLPMPTNLGPDEPESGRTRAQLAAAQAWNVLKSGL